ncbi:hypothetical protein [Streptomyces sp. NPDC001135]
MFRNTAVPPARAPNIALVPGTSSPEHVRENIAAASLVLPDDAVADLNGIGAERWRGLNEGRGLKDPARGTRGA